MDGFGGEEPVVLLAATNWPDVLDKARALRPQDHPCASAPGAAPRYPAGPAKTIPLADNVDLDRLAESIVVNGVSNGAENRLREALRCRGPALWAIGFAPRSGRRGGSPPTKAGGRVTRLVPKMVAHLGMSERIGPASFPQSQIAARSRTAFGIRRT